MNTWNKSNIESHIGGIAAGHESSPCRRAGGMDVVVGQPEPVLFVNLGIRVWNVI